MLGRSRHTATNPRGPQRSSVVTAGKPLTSQAVVRAQPSGHTPDAPSKWFIAASRHGGLGFSRGTGRRGSGTRFGRRLGPCGRPPEVEDARIGRARLRRSGAPIVRRRLAGVVSVLAVGVGVGVDVGAGAVPAVPSAAPVLRTALRAPAGTLKVAAVATCRSVRSRPGSSACRSSTRRCSHTPAPTDSIQCFSD